MDSLQNRSMICLPRYVSNYGPTFLRQFILLLLAVRIHVMFDYMNHNIGFFHGWMDYKHNMNLAVLIFLDELPKREDLNKFSYKIP